MKTKPKLMVCALIFVSGAILNLFFSTAVHGLLTREITRLSLLPIGDCLASLFSNRQHMMLYPDVMDIGQMCEALGVSTKTGYKLLKDGKIEYLKIGRAYRIPKAHILRYLKITCSTFAE